MKTVILDVATRQEAGEDFIRAWETGKARETRERLQAHIRSTHQDLEQAIARR